MKAQGKTIIVTGGGNGIGRALVLNLLSKGAKVLAIDINQTALQETAQLAGELAPNYSMYVVNIAHKEEVEKFAAEVITQFGGIDGLINNAGIIQPFVRVADLDYTAIERVMNVNFYGTLYMIKAFLPHFRTRNEAHIVNISSMGGFLPVPGQSIYGASKAAVKLLTEALYAELLNTNIQVTIVYPGAIGTNIAQNSNVSVPNMTEADIKKSSIQSMPPAQAAEIVIKGMEENKNRIYVGKDSKLMNILYRLSPGFATRFISKQMKSLLPPV